MPAAPKKQPAPEPESTPPPAPEPPPAAGAAAGDATQKALLQIPPGPINIWQSPASLAHAKEIARIWSEAGLLPEAYRKNPFNCLIIFDMAQRLEMDAMMLMNAIDVIRGRPALRSQFIIATINASGKFKGMLRFKMSGEIGANNRACVAYAIEKATNEIVEGTAISLQMAKVAGWYDRDGSHWKVNPELMLQYRAAALFGRLYVPERLMGLHSVEEVHDIIDIDKEGNVIPPATGVVAANKLLDV